MYYYHITSIEPFVTRVYLNQSNYWLKIREFKIILFLDSTRTILAKLETKPVFMVVYNNYLTSVIIYFWNNCLHGYIHPIDHIQLEFNNNRDHLEVVEQYTWDLQSYIT